MKTWMKFTISNKRKRPLRVLSAFASCTILAQASEHTAEATDLSRPSVDTTVERSAPHNEGERLQPAQTSEVIQTSQASRDGHFSIEDQVSQILQGFLNIEGVKEKLREQLISTGYYSKSDESIFKPKTDEEATKVVTSLLSLINKNQIDIKSFPREAVEAFEGFKTTLTFAIEQITEKEEQARQAQILADAEAIVNALADDDVEEARNVAKSYKGRLSEFDQVLSTARELGLSEKEAARLRNKSKYS